MLISRILEFTEDPLELEEHKEEYCPNYTNSDALLYPAWWREKFPYSAGQGIQQEPTIFKSLHNAQVTWGESIWEMFMDERDWDFVQWILKSGTTCASTNKLLLLKKVSLMLHWLSRELTEALQIRDVSCTSFHNSWSLFQKIDSLPSGPDWTCKLLKVEGDILNNGGGPRTETVELWHWNPVKCVQELIRNPEFKPYMKYAPYHLYMSDDGTNQCWDEMATGSWWWDIQVRSRGTQLAKLMMKNTVGSLT